MENCLKNFLIYKPVPKTVICIVLVKLAYVDNLLLTPSEHIVVNTSFLPYSNHNHCDG